MRCVWAPEGTPPSIADLKRINAVAAGPAVQAKSWSGEDPLEMKSRTGLQRTSLKFPRSGLLPLPRTRIDAEDPVQSIADSGATPTSDRSTEVKRTQGAHVVTPAQQTRQKMFGRKWRSRRKCSLDNAGWTLKFNRPRFPLLLTTESRKVQ